MADRLEKLIEARFGRARARTLAESRAGLLRDVQYMDVKMLSEVLEKYRAHVRKAVAGLRAARKVVPFARVQGAQRHRLDMERQALDDALLLWRMAHVDYHAAYHAYLAKCGIGQDTQTGIRRAA